MELNAHSRASADEAKASAIKCRLEEGPAIGSQTPGPEFGRRCLGRPRATAPRAYSFLLPYGRRTSRSFRA
jgi:hypothetical protein